MSFVYLFAQCDTKQQHQTQSEWVYLVWRRSSAPKFDSVIVWRGEMMDHHFSFFRIGSIRSYWRRHCVRFCLVFLLFLYRLCCLSAWVNHNTVLYPSLIMFSLNHLCHICFSIHHQRKSSLVELHLIPHLGQMNVAHPFFIPSCCWKTDEYLLRGPTYVKLLGSYLSRAVLTVW